MNSLIVVCCLLSSLIAEGYSLSCYDCVGDNVNSCTGPTRQCQSDEDACISLLAEYNGFRMFARSCGKQNLACGISGSVTLDSVTLRATASCCYTNNCLPSTPTLPTRRTEKNGVTCPMCVSLFYTTHCDDNYIKECTGDETKCTTITSKGLNLNEEYRGCATPSVCNLGSQTATIYNNEYSLDITCKNDSDFIQHSSFSLVLAVSIVLKIIL